MLGMASAEPRVRAWSERFRQNPLARELVTSLADRAPEIWRRTFDLLRKESPEYRNAVDDEFTAESKRHCGELLEGIIGIAAGRLRRTDPFAFVRTHAEWRARHHVPLVASLHAYRLAHKTYWGITRERLTEHRKRKDAMRALEFLSDFWIELFETVGAVLEEAHAAEDARASARNSEAHARLMDDLLKGVEPAGTERRRVLSLCGIRPGQKLAVAVMRAEHDDHVDAEISSRSLLRLVEETMPPALPGRLMALRNGEIVLIAAGEGDSSRRLARHLARVGIGKRCTAGVGSDKGEFARLPESLTEARMALEAGGARGVRHFADIDLGEFVIERADRAAQRLVPQWVREMHAADRGNDLLHTIRAFAECSLNVKQTARRLGVHTNTVYFRLNRISKLTGVDPRTYSGTSLLLTVLRLLDAHAKGQENS